MKPIILGLTVYGYHHVEMFLRYCWPSLMSPGNLDALRKERDVGVIIHTNQESAPLLKNIPFPILDVTTEDKYLQLGRHQNYDLAMAKQTGADYHLLMPDFVYSENCFAGIMRAANRGHKAIARLVVSTTKETICPLLKPNISATELATLSIQHMHPGIKHWLAGKDGYPNTHVIAWEGKDTIRMCSPHVSPVYIANDVIHLNGENVCLDAVLDNVVIGDIYLPKPEDEIVIIEVSPRDSRPLNDERVSLAEFGRIFKHDTKNSLRQWTIFDHETVDPVNRSALGGDYWNDVEINEQKRIVNEELMLIMGFQNA